MGAICGSGALYPAHHTGSLPEPLDPSIPHDADTGIRFYHEPSAPPQTPFKRTHNPCGTGTAHYIDPELVAHDTVSTLLIAGSTTAQLDLDTIYELSGGAVLIRDVSVGL